MTIKTKSIRAQIALRQLGKNLKTARLKRRFAIKDFASRVGVSDRTIMRLEKGDEGVSIGTLSMACLVLGEIERLDEMLDPASDETALMLDRARLPKRINGKLKMRPAQSESDSRELPNSDSPDDEGVGF